MAALMDITVAVEMHDDTLADTADSALRLLQDVGARNLGVNYQVARSPNAEDAHARLRAVLPYVVHLHAQNHRPSRRSLDGRTELAPLSRGLVDYRAIVRALHGAGYRGFVHIEFVPPSGGDKVKALAADYRFLRSLCDGP
jgi:sugar phosphate isomerase/epimerase